jgi:hypothetical protein
MLFYAQKMPKKDLFAHASQYGNPCLLCVCSLAKFAEAAQGRRIGRMRGRAGRTSPRRRAT